MELTIRDEDGSEKPAMVMGRVRYENGSFVPDANGNIIEYFMDGEVKHDHEDKLVDKVVSHVAPQQPEAAPVQEASAETPATVETTPPPVEQPTEVAPQQVQEPVQTVEPQPAQPAEAPAQPTEQPTAEPMPVGEDGEEDWQATTPERAHAYIFNEAGLSRSEGNEFIAAQTQAAQSALVKAKSAQMPRVGTSIKKYNEAKAKRQEKIDEAQRVLDYWQQVRNIQNDIQRVENERRAAEDAVRHDEAVAEAQAEYEARKQAEAERKAVGNENPMPAITEKWNNATKVDGHRDEIMLPDGTPLKGHYVLHESGASSPSHNPETWQKTDGFPMDANDNSVNDRDYERDHDAQEHTQSIARQYDQRALQSVPVVSNDGVVLSGNGRTMAGELAARDNTDGAYVNYLKEYAPKFGFTPEQVEAMQHPRVSFVPDEAMPYTAETFAKFNQQEMKSQNKTEQAVKLGKTVNDDSFKGIVRTINGYDTLGDFYNDAEASLGAVYDLHNAGVVPQAQLAEMVDGVRGQEKLSAVGREFLENMLIGKAFEGDPEVVRMLTAEPAMRQTVITALGEIVDNIALGGDWSLQGELADAVKLCFDARQGGAKYGEIVSTYARQGVLFADPDELQTVADFNNATMLMLADALNDKRVTLLKTTLQLYNNNARQSAVGQADLFAGGIQSREDILRDVITFINENYGKRKEIEAARAEAVERRKAESVQQDGTPPAVSTDGEETAEPSAEPAPVEAEPVEATEPVEAEPNAVQTALAAAEQETNTEPTEAQKEAGNYKKGHVKIDGYDVTIENPKGSVRRGTDASGKQWEQEMQNTYGYIRGTEGVDGDHIDVFFSEDPSQGDVFVVDQVNKDGSFDEHKVMYGFPDIESARKAYLSNYEDGWQGLGAITTVSKEEFKKWIDSSHRKTKPFADYSSVKPLGDTQLGEQPTAGYSIEPTTYTNKKGKTTPMHLVTFGRELSKDEIRAGKELAKESRGWWDREKGGFMMRDEDSAKALAEALSNEEAVQDAQPLSVEDVATVTEQADMKAVDETIKVEQEPQTTPQYYYDREDDVYDKTLTGLRNVLNDRKRGAIPNIKSIENVIRDLRKRAKTIEDGMATAAGETIPQAFDALANLNGRRKAYEQFLVDIRRKMAETERDDALAAHGVKLGDKIMYKGKEVTIHDADARQVTLDVGLAPVMYEVTDWENVEVPKREPATTQPKKVNVESLMGELNEKGEAKLSDHTEEQQQEESTEQPKQEEKKAKSKWVDDADAEHFEELRRRLRQKLGGQLNMGIDPEAFALGVEMSYLMLKHGARKFAEFAKQMIEALGENVRPYLKSFYNGARDLPEMAEYEKELTPYDEVRTFDVMNFDKEGAKDIVATAEHIVREQAAEREAKEATDKLKQERNEQRKETEQEVAANTEALASEAATVASEVESKLPSARSEREVNDLAKSIDDAIDKVNDQLALLGYYEAEPVESDFNEAYGYMRNAEKKAVKNVTELFKTLTKELGISDPVVYDTKGKKQKSVTANIAPAGGDVTMRFMLNRDKGVELYIDFMLEPDYENNRDNLVLKGIMFRPEKNLPNGGRDYLRANNFFPVDVTVPQMLHGIRSVCQEWLPAEDYVAMAQRVAAENAGNQKEKTSKGSKSKKKSVSLHEQTIPDLFSGLFGEDELNSKDNDTARTDNTKGFSREDGSVGSVPADRDGVLDTRSTGGTERGETTGVSDETGAVADGTRTGVPGRRSSGSAEGGDNLASEAGQPLSERGQRVRDRADEDGRSAIAGTADESQGTSQPTGRRGNVKSSKQPEPKFTRNYLYPEDASAIDNMTPQQRLSANVEALEVVRTLMKEGREATAEEREILGKYRGWGGVELGRAYSTDMMRRSFTDRWGTPTEQGKLLGRLADVIDELDPKGERGVLSAINRAALTSYYTPTGIAKVMNRFAELAGFKGGSMLDPSMGNGVFEGTMSKGVQQRTMIHGIELDWLTGQIARNLYPDANVLVTGYEQAGTADNAYDVVMSNIPFGSISVTDKTWKHDSSPVRKAAQGKIHNYFAVKMLDNTRPGGLCVIMTSNAILDTKGNQIIREHLADQAEVLGVVRLPDNTFKGAGTSVVTDVIFLRKYKDDADRAAIRGNEDYTANIEKPFLSSGELQLTNPTDGKTYKVTVNGYFTKNKGMMIGDAKAGGQYRADEFGLGSSLGTDELANAMSKIVEKKIVGDRKGKLFDTHKTEREVHQAVSEAYKGDGNFISSGNIVEQDGMFGIVTSNKNKYGDVTSTFNEMPSLKAKASRIRAMLPIREAMKELIAAEIGGTKEDVLKELRNKLQGAYDAYVKKFGHLNNKENDFLTEDIDGYTLRSLERWKEGKFDGLSDIFTKNTIKPALDLSTAKTPADAISLSLAEYGEINPSFMEDVLGESWAEQCGETLFRTPFTEDVFETADAYLSGDVKTKLEQAREAAKQDKSFERNVEALEAVQPKDIPFEDISIRMGARWIPAEVYTDFMFDMFGIRKNDWKGNKSGVEYMPEVDQYVVNVANNELGGEADAWRTSRRAASEVFTAALQDKSLSVFDTIKEDGKEIKVLNKEETELLNNKIQDLRTAFEDWLSQNPEREEMLMRLYNDKFNRTVLRKFDGSHLNVAGLMGKELRPHQKDAVWMLINNRGGIVDHIVGAGKTLVMQSAIMEMRRMGIAKKPMIIGLKATVAQIAKEFREAYPAARILAPTEKDFSKENRKRFMSQIALNDYDCVILSHDQYCMLPHTEEVERGVIDEQMMQLDAAIEYLYGQSDKNQLTKKQIKGLEKRKANLEAKLDKLLDRKIDREFTFEGLGVDYLFVDECQHFKSLPYVSTYDRVAGLGDKQGSQRAIALLNGVRYLQRMHQGDRGTVFLSGTTISNSLSEIYHLLNYLRPSEMERLGMTTFDAWAGNYAIHTAELEYGVTNELKEKDRFRSLTNIPELSKMYAEIADVRNDLNLKLPKPKMRSHVVTVPQSDIMQEINAEIVKMVKNKDGMYFGIDSKDTTPWGLLASTLSAKAAINPRLIDEAYDSEGGKIPAVCENVKKIYDQFAGQKGTQLIFCDTGVPGNGKKYDAYSDIINRLVNDYGIPRKEIADIHEAGTDEKRKALFAKVNDGSVRILIGGTKNMGTGVNVQKRIVAMHHVDVPWTPADREQREGRGVRQGNEIARDFNDDNVDVYFYATEGSLDMYKYQLQETKGKLFAQFKSGTIGERTFDEGDAEGDFDPAEVVAMLSGNPVIFEKSKQDKKVEKLRRAKRAYESDWQRRRSRYEELQQKKRNFERLLSLNASDVRDLERGGFTPDEEGKYPTTVTVSVKDDYSSRRTFDKPKEAGEYIHSLLKQGKKVQLTGFNQKANITVPITDAGLFGKPVAELDSYGGIKYTVEVSDDDTAAGVAFRNLLQKVYSNRKVYERNLEDVNNQLKGADPGENKFPKQAELDEALKEKKRLDDEYKKLSDEESKPTSDEDTAKYRIREDAPPTKTGIGYKVFVLKDGKLYPPMVANPNGEATPVGVWLDADAAPVAGVTKTGRQQVKAGGKGTQGGSGKLAYRPGWHLGEIPYALQFNRMNPETGQRELFPANFVWAEVEYANDVDYQEEAMSYGMNASGKFQHSLAGLPRLPENGSYRYRTNPDPNTDPWVITGAMKVNRILKPSEVDAMVEAAGREPQQRQAGAITDEQVEALNAKVKRTMQEDRDMMRSAVQQMGEKLHTDINIIEDVNEITHQNAAVQERRRKSKGWYDTATGQVNIVLDNNKNIDDVKASVGHETIAHKGLRELVGEENYDEFLDETYQHLRDDLKKGVDDAAGRAFIDDTTKNGNRAKSYEQHRRTAVDELFGRMAEKPFEEFSEGERTLWQKIKATVRRLLDKFLGSLKLPKWFELGDNELRYILWRSKERLERGKEHPIDLARDIVKREELGLTDEARYNMGDAPETFKARQRRAAENKGTVMPGLNDAQVKVVDVPRHHYTGNIAEATRQAIEAAKAKFAPNGKARTLRYDNFGATFDYSISGSAVEESLNPKQQAKSVNKGVHIAMAEHLDEIIGQSIEVEEHPDYLKNEKGERNTSIINDKALMHRFYGAVVVDGVPYRVMTLMREDRRFNEGNAVHAYEVQKIEVLDEETPNTPNGSHTSKVNALVPVAVAKVIKNVEKSYDTGKNLLEQSKLADESTDLYRDPEETEDIWNDQSLGLQERITAAATRLANNHRDNKTLRNDAMRAIGGNLSDLRKAMSLQRTFDMTTVKRVADLARVLMNNGYLNGLTQQEVKRLLAAVKNSVGHNDIEGDVQKVMDIMVDNQLKHAEDTLHELEAIRGSKVDARGVEVQGQLDPAGAHIMKVFKKTRGWEKTDIEEAISEAQQRMGSSDVAVADEAALEYTGLQLALEYAENIKDSKVEERKLREEIKQAHDDASERDRATDSYRQYIASLQEAIRQNKIERAQSYFDLVGRLSDSLRESIANAKDFKEAEKQRIREIQHNANSDMEGRPSDEHYKPTFADKFVNNSFVSFLFAPLATFDQMLRMFGSKSANGEGYLYNRFMRGWIDARQKEINGVRDKYAILDAKAAELFGGKVKTWGDLIRRVGKLPKGTVSFWNGGEMQEREMTQGNLMYIYMVNKMLDGRMKLRKMGITEENVADIEEVLDPRLIELADWLQDEFLVQTRNEYNETHKRMFGASMAAIEHYFPLKILANARADKPEDLDNPDKSDGISTATGSIIKRRRNALALDITGADALSVILDHVAQMEHWNAFAEFNRDINTLRTYKRFRNQVQNMTTIYGSGKELWKKFNDVCQMAAGTYRPPRTKLDEAAVNFAKGVTAAKVSFRMFTALKQFLSMPAYIPEARTDYLLMNIANPVGAWKWSMEHLPIFSERWRSRMSGDPRLLKSDMDWKMWRTRLMQLASRAGMSPNAFVDALTVSIGAHSMYQTRLAQYLRDGYSEADAEKKAVQDAEVLYNQTQQSSEGAFTSTMQVDRSWLSVLFTVFRNASMSYQRQLHDAFRSFKHNLTPGGRARSIEFMKKQYVRDGIDEAQAEQNAKRKFRRQLLKDTLRVATFGYIMQFAWNLGAYLPYLLFGDDEDEKQKMWDDVWAHTAFGSVEGLTGGDLMSQAGQMMLTAEGNPAYLSKDMPLTSDIMAAFQKLGNGQHTEALNDMINLIVQAGLGVNPQSITDVALSIMDACGDDPTLAHEATICISRILQVPQSQIDKMYFDEVGLSGDEVSKYTPAQLAERYAQFKVKRGRFFSPWSWGDEERIKKFTDKANKTIKERTEQMGDKHVNEAYLQYEEVYKGVDAKVKEAKKTAKTDYVEAAQLMADAQSDPNAFATYKMFKQMDGNFNKIVKFYLGAKTPDEAALCRQAVLDYKSAMVKVLEAPDASTRADAMNSLGTVMQGFTQKYIPMQQPNR
jgi:N12 class adenine-specific DNA methylase/transposase